MGGRRSPLNRSAYSGGYSDTIKRQLERVVIPEKIKCVVCEKFRMQSAYSKRQIDILRNVIVVQGPRAAHGAHARCRVCVGGPNSEIRCYICDQTKGLEEFAKNQRQNRDIARCLNCVQNHTDAEPVLEENKHLLEIDGTATSIATSQLGDEMSANTTRKPSEKGEDVDDETSSGGGVWLEKGKHKASTEEKGSGYQSNAYGPQGNLHRRTAAPSEVSQSVYRGWDSWGVTASASNTGFSGYNYSSPAPRRSSNFARIPAVRAERSDAPTKCEPEPSRPSVESDDEYDGNGPEYYL
ncbi:uncharacterized protein KD926_001879 [Aspergillus affinis]|uniref:uncharacterized protein n=1 Tax=Aspergillus affinis TaxID=1070780 RepID=UPI0022FE8670|nr:uncharacterized protein KD926_001879 [Aspergillus affinis]KAI9044056.1 hypothetical protein KD926_001879 [Aspergillus affinis]